MKNLSLCFLTIEFRRSLQAISLRKKKKGSTIIKESFQKWYYRLEKWRNKEAAKFFVYGKCVAKHRKMATLLGLKRSVNGGRR